MFNGVTPGGECIVTGVVRGMQLSVRRGLVPLDCDTLQLQACVGLIDCYTTFLLESKEQTFKLST